MSCLFRSLAKFVKTDDEYLIRQKICNYLILKKPIASASSEDYIAWESNMDLTSYVSKMRTPEIWGGAIEIQVFCELYNYNVSVVNIRSQPHQNMDFESTRKNQGALKFASLTWNGGHYEAVL